MQKKLSLLLTAVLLSALCLPALATDLDYHEPGSQVCVTIPIHRDSGICDFIGYFELTRGLEWVRTYTIPEKFLKSADSRDFFGTFVGVTDHMSLLKDISLTFIVKIKDDATPIQWFHCPAIWTSSSPAPTIDTEVTINHFTFPIAVKPNLSHIIRALPETEKPETEENPVPKVGVYPNNTMCIMGPRLRDIAPGSTDKWYMVTPVDISQDGEQVFPLVASNMYRVGTAIVAVKEGQLTVNYRTLDGVTVHSEHLAIYPDLEAAVKQKAAGLDGVLFKPGEPISIADDLAGDTSVLLLMCNQVSYTTEVRGLSRFYSGAPDVKDVLKQMQEMIR